MLLPKVANRTSEDKQSDFEFKSSGSYRVNMFRQNTLDHTACRFNNFSIG